MNRQTTIDRINAAFAAHDFALADRTALLHYHARFADGWRPSYKDSGRLLTSQGYYACQVQDAYHVVFASHEMDGTTGQVRSIGTIDAD